MPRYNSLTKKWYPNKCSECDGRGFFLYDKVSPNGKIEPNEVVECEDCNGTGDDLSDKV